MFVGCKIVFRFGPKIYFPCMPAGREPRHACAPQIKICAMPAAARAFAPLPCFPPCPGCALPLRVCLRGVCPSPRCRACPLPAATPAPCPGCALPLRVCLRSVRVSPRCQCLPCARSHPCPPLAWLWHGGECPCAPLPTMVEGGCAACAAQPRAPHAVRCFSPLNIVRASRGVFTSLPLPYS